jgi:hypothetical protein
MNNEEALLHYWHTGYSHVEGWMGDGLFPRLQLCARVQESSGARGGAVEIGIHHGQFFIALNQFCTADEPSMAIDIFDRQELNVDHSGQGSLERFTDNLRKYCRHGGSNVHITAADSTTLTPRDILGKLSMKPRYFSIDGGHTVRHVMNDMALADACIADFGIVLVDDILNPHWLGVIDGVCRYLMPSRLRVWRPAGIVPFAINSNKLFLCRPGAHDKYVKAFKECPPTPNTVEFFGKTVLVW